MSTLYRLWHRVRRRDHVPRLWPIALVDFDTREVHYELGTFNAEVKRVCPR